MYGSVHLEGLIGHKCNGNVNITKCDLVQL